MKFAWHAHFVLLNFTNMDRDCRVGLKVQTSSSFKVALVP
jgi:hypothetical protein